MPNLTTALPRQTGNLEDDYNRLYNWAVSLTDELKSLLCNLDAGNVTEAASIKAQNIDVSQARIKDAQITSLTADKLTAGTIDTGQITVKGKSEGGGTTTMTGDYLVFEDKNGNERVYIGDDGTGNVIFALQNATGTEGVYMDGTGKVSLTGNIETSQDCLIQGELRVGLGGNNTKGISFYGDSYTPDADGNYSTSYARILPYVANNEDFKGINVVGGVLCNFGSPVATENEINELQKQIDNLKKQLDTMS